jgi:tetratricopeptide (TPR) repeat protein
MKSARNWKEQNARGVTLFQQGWHSEAASLAEETLKLAQAAFGPAHPNVAESLSNLALIYYAQGKDAERAIFEQALPTSEENASESYLADTSQSLNKLVLLNFAKTKYSRAESLLNRALEIKKEVLGTNHPNVLDIIGNLAALYNSQGKHSEAYSLLRSVRSPNTIASENIHLADVDLNSRGFIAEYENRESMRYFGHFPVRVSKKGSASSIRGVTLNLSETGALIKTNDLMKFRVNEQISVYIFIPSLFSARFNTVGMHGDGIVIRLDEQNKCIGIRFRTSFKQFERTGEIEVPEKARYKKLAHYLPDSENVSANQFSEKYPASFLVEKAKIDLEKEVIFQMSTKQLDNPDLLKELDVGVEEADSREARVVEINQGKIDSNHGVITIGRAASNDIVLYSKLISKSHAFLFFLSLKLDPYLVDLGSANGTFLNEEKMVVYEMYQLKDGDEISFGPQVKVGYLSARGFYDLLASMKRNQRG